MAVKMRLTRLGDKKSPFYRIVVVDSRKARDGQYVDLIGTYDLAFRRYYLFLRFNSCSWPAVAYHRGINRHILSGYCSYPHNLTSAIPASTKRIVGPHRIFSPPFCNSSSVLINLSLLSFFFVPWSRCIPRCYVTR